MRLVILNVNHGFCCIGVAENKKVLMIDCGHNSLTGLRPSLLLRGLEIETVDQLVISNFDEDHLSDLPNVEKLLNVNILARNPSLSASDFRSLKLEAGLGRGCESLSDMMDLYCMAPIDLPEFPGVGLTFFWNLYPDFTDTNNLSLVTVLEYGGLSILFPGDMERVGWMRLLLNPYFRAMLARINIFIAAHHGRESGYCKEVFDWCYPEVIVISDGPIGYQSQEVNYSRHARGIWWNTTRRRSVLTTRTDGGLGIRQRPGFGFWIDGGLG